jgi:hypothetical protein
VFRDAFSHLNSSLAAVYVAHLKVGHLAYGLFACSYLQNNNLTKIYDGTFALGALEALYAAFSFDVRDLFERSFQQGSSLQFSA